MHAAFLTVQSVENEVLLGDVKAIFALLGNNLPKNREGERVCKSTHEVIVHKQPLF